MFGEKQKVDVFREKPKAYKQVKKNRRQEIALAFAGLFGLVWIVIFIFLFVG